jgi:hypothetical protein
LANKKEKEYVRNKPVDNKNKLPRGYIDYTNPDSIEEFIKR